MSKQQRRPPNRHTAGIPADILRLETAQARCPSGHALPHKTNRGRCTPVHCAGSASGKNPGDVSRITKGEVVENTRLGSALKASKREALEEISREADALIDNMITGNSLQAQAGRAAAKAQKGEELIKLAHNIGRWAAMRTYFKVPDGLAGAEAEEYVKRKAEILSVDAVTDLERDLKLGDDTQRREARRDLLDMAGLRRREAAVGGGSVIVLINQKGQEAVPLIQRKIGQSTIDVAPSASAPALPTGPTGPKGGA